jgi:hypothetical protein
MSRARPIVMALGLGAALVSLTACGGAGEFLSPNTPHQIAPPPRQTPDPPDANPCIQSTQRAPTPDAHRCGGAVL